jgi:ComF family protein
MQLPAPVAAIADMLFPPRCPLCGEPVVEHGGLCPGCWSGLVQPGQPACASCQRPFAGELPEGAVCAPCMAQAPRHDGIAAGTIYNEPIRRLILAYKRGGRIALAPLFARLIAPRLAGLHGGIGPGWLLVPVPLHRWRLWRRGYNQSALLARELSRSTGAKVVVDALRRQRHTPSLAGKDRLARARILSGALVVEPKRRAMLKGARVVLVDDVLTSGATSNACVRALKRAGVEKVVIACIARVLEEALPKV